MLYKADVWTNGISFMKVHGWSTNLGGIDDIEPKVNPPCWLPFSLQEFAPHGLNFFHKSNHDPNANFIAM